MDPKRLGKVGATSALFLLCQVGEAANPTCAPERGASCNQDDCCRIYCLGPENTGGNPSVRPRTCDGDVSITASVFYWNAHQDGMEYAIRNESDDMTTALTGRLSLINAEFLSPEFKWDFGYKLGLGYNSTCDGWDVSVLWTHYKGKASSHVEAELDDNQILLTLCAKYVNLLALNEQPNFARDIETNWKLNLNFIDFELGREFWNSRLLSLRPYIGVRVALIDQDYNLQYKGGVWADPNPNLVGFTDFENTFHSGGVRGGLESNWNFGCGFSLFGNLALSALYGSFEMDHDESTREAAAPFHKTKVTETADQFHASVLASDIEIGLQYLSVFCEGQYALTARLGWEHHFIQNQNQFWCVNNYVEPSSNHVQNLYNQRRGDLTTQGLTLTLKFDF